MPLTLSAHVLMHEAPVLALVLILSLHHLFIYIIHQITGYSATTDIVVHLEEGLWR